MWRGMGGNVSGWGERVSDDRLVFASVPLLLYASTLGLPSPRLIFPVFAPSLRFGLQTSLTSFASPPSPPKGHPWPLVGSRSHPVRSTAPLAHCARRSRSRLGDASLRVDAPHFCSFCSADP